MKDKSSGIIYKRSTDNTVRGAFFLILLIFFSYSCRRKQQLLSAESGISVSVNQKTGGYAIQSKSTDWTFKGSIGKQLSNVKTSNGQDSIGSYRQISFQWKSDNHYVGSIRRYNDKPIVVFSLTTPNKVDQIKTIFPSFHTFPKSMYHYSFGDKAASPPKFRLTQTSTPWLFFNQQKQAYIISPASDFMVSKMTGDGDTVINSGLNSQLKNLPVNFTHKTILVMGDGIQKTWAVWGNALMKMYGKKRSGNESDPILKYYGYWTDNGAAYYYNYIRSKGYGGTLRAVRKQYKKEGITMGYMQLDSWWYEKSIYNISGKPTAGHKNRNFPAKGEWNRYGGLLTYRADRYVFPHGLKSFHQSVGVPLVVHNRYIALRSPYRNEYKITGYAAVDPRFWNDIASFIKSAGVVVYEQDWLNVIYNHTPRMASKLSVGNAFTDNMAKAFKTQGIDMQYCMATPRYFMQGVKYNNLTTIRVSGDRLEPTKWRHFIYTSQLGYNLGIWPWSDVFMSHETGNMIISVLSAGAVGTGDALGKEYKTNIMRAGRKDGVLVKPDAALLPMDIDYINDARHADKPMLAFTYTKQNNIRTNYVFAFAPNNSKDKLISFQLSTLGMKGKVVVYDPLSGAMKEMNANDTFTDIMSDTTNIIEKTSTTGGSISYRYTYYIIAPITSVGVSFLGDEGKIVATGRQRIPELSFSQNKLQVQVVFAKGESSVKLHGYYDKPFRTDKGILRLDPENKMFTLIVSVPEKNMKVTVNFTPI
ncbi:MAG: hypothetical protein GXO86_10530 [Chlorobi bacterium]|nr:hypothetical protein [Chlorobiota bacterium]